MLVHRLQSPLSCLGPAETSVLTRSLSLKAEVVMIDYMYPYYMSIMSLYIAGKIHSSAGLLPIPPLLHQPLDFAGIFIVGVPALKLF